MNTANADRLASEKRWAQWAKLAVERLPWRYSWTVAVLWLAGLGEQALEEWYLDPTFASLGLRIGKRIGFLALALYTPLMLKLLRLRAVTALAELRPIVQVGDGVYEARVRRMIGADKRAEWILLLLAVVTVVVWFVLLRNRLPISGAAPLYLPRELLPALFMLVTYSLLGWVLLVLFFVTLQLGLGLGGLANHPLAVDPYNTGPLLPFGRLAALHSLSVAGVVFMMILSLGQPNQLLDYAAVALLSLASVLALVAPIWGVYRQMEKARLAALGEINRQLKQIHTTLLGQPELPPVEVGGLANRTAALVHLRTVIKESPKWPFRNEAAIARSFVAALTPLIYFILNETMRIYILPVIARRP